MIPDPYVAAAGATSAEVAALMRMKDISVVPVVDNPKDRRYLGTISDRDIVTRCVAAGHDPKECSAEDHVRTDTAVVTPDMELVEPLDPEPVDRKSTRLNSSHSSISYAVFCLKKKNKTNRRLIHYIKTTH